MTEKVGIGSLPCRRCGKPVFYEMRGWVPKQIICDGCFAQDHPVDLDGPANRVPPRFWASLSDEELHEACETGVFNKALCERLYRMTDRHDEPPDHIRPYISREGVESWLKTLKKGKRKRNRVKGRP